MDDHHSGVYKLRLKNDSGVFESVAKVEIEVPEGRKKKAVEEVKVVVEEVKEVQVALLSFTNCLVK